MANIRVPDPLPPAITRPRRHVEAVLAQSLLESGQGGRVALAWAWALNGTGLSPITLTQATGQPPSREEILAEAGADPDDCAAPPDVPAGYGEDHGYAWAVLTWLTGVSDEIPLDDDQRGRFIGARDDYARTDDQIRQARDQAARSLAEFDLPEPMAAADAARPWQWEPAWMNAAWQRGIRDLLDWVLGDRPASPLCGRVVAGLPDVCDLSYEEAAVSGIVARRRPRWPARRARRLPPPQYADAVQAAIVWLRGETTTGPSASMAAVCAWRKGELARRAAQ